MLRPVSVHWMYQKCLYRDSSSMYNVIMYYLNSFLSCSIRNLTLSSLSILLTIKIDVIPHFTNFYSHSGLFPFLFCLIYKSSYVLRPVSVHWMYQKCSYRDSSSMYNVIMHYLNSFLSCSIRNLTLASLSILLTIKIDVIPHFTNFYSHSGLFP